MSVTGLSVVVDQGRKQLAMHGKLVESCSQAEGLRRFVSWLENIGKSVVLVAHNCYTFDMRAFVNAARREGLFAEIQEWVDGFCDSLPIFKQAFPGHSSYSLSHPCMQSGLASHSWLMMQLPMLLPLPANCKMLMPTYMHRPSRCHLPRLV